MNLLYKKYTLLLLCLFILLLSLTPYSSIFGNPYMQRNSFIIDTAKIYNQTLNYQSNSKVAFDGSNFLVVWEDLRKDEYSQIRGCRISSDGQILDKGGFTISLMESYTYTPNLVFDGLNYLIVWKGKNQYHFPSINGARISPSGQLLDSFPIPISYPFPSTSSINRPDVASSGTNFLTVWTELEFGIKGARLSPQGVLLDSTPIFLSSVQIYPQNPAVSFDGINYLVVWEDFEEVSWDSCYKYIRGARVSIDGTLIDTIPFTFITYSTTTHFPQIKDLIIKPALYFGNKNYLLVWNFINPTGDYSMNIYGVRISPEGSLLDTNYIPISTASGNQVYPSLAFDSSEFLVTWEDHRNNINGFNPSIYFTKVDTSGNVLDTLGTSLLTDTTINIRNPSVCYGGGEHLISFTDRRGNMFRYDIDDDIFVSRVDISGNPLDSSGIPLSISTQHQRNPAVGYSGDNHLIVWEDERGNDIDIYGALVDTLGNLIIPPGVFVVSNAEYNQVKPIVDFVDPYYLVAWQDYRDSSFFQKLYCTRIKKDGTVLDPDGIYLELIDTTFSIFPFISISNDSTNFLFAWQKKRAGGGGYFKIIASRVDTSGTILDPEGIIIDTIGYSPAISFDGNNWLICYKSYSGIKGIRLSSNGNIIHPSFKICNWYNFPTEPPSVTFNGDYYLVTWTTVEGYYPLNENIYGSRVSPYGYDIDTIDIAISSKPLSEYMQQLESHGGNFFSIWVDTRNVSNPYEDCTKSIYGTYIDPDGVVIDTNGIIFSPTLSESKSPAIVRSSGNRFFLCYSGFTESPYGSYRIYGQFINALIGIEESKKDKISVNKLGRNYPNPFSTSTIIQYKVREKGFINLYIYNLAGRLIRKIVNEWKDSGIFTARWDGKDKNGIYVSNGIYFYKLFTKDYSKTRKMVFIR